MGQVKLGRLYISASLIFSSRDRPNSYGMLLTTLKNIRLARKIPATDKRSSLFQPTVNDEEKVSAIFTLNANIT